MTSSAGLRAADVLEIADEGAGRDAAERGMLLLEAALPDVRSEELASFGLGARDGWVLELRCGTFGDTLPGRVRCPSCGQLLTVAIPRSHLEMSLRSGEEALPREVEVSVDEVRVVARGPDAEALGAAAASPDVVSARRSLIAGCVVSARRRGRRVDPLKLAPDVLEAVGEALVAADPSLEVRVGLTCAGCGLEWAPVIDVAQFFWKELVTASVQIVDDVHQLATAYGWSEPEVLSLSSRRRRRYVERLLGG
jgi:hypothetical protein